MVIIKSIIVVILLLCLLPMPYQYYSIVRFSVTISMIIFAIKDNPEKSFGKFCFYVFIGSLFNPIAIIELPRIAWNIIDVMLALVLFISAVAQYNDKNVPFFNNKIEEK